MFGARYHVASINNSYFMSLGPENRDVSTTHITPCTPAINFADWVGGIGSRIIVRAVLLKTLPSPH